MAFWKMVGLDVMPRTPRSTQRRSSPSVIQPRLRLSSQGLWPCSSYSSLSLPMGDLPVVGSVVVRWDPASLPAVGAAR